MLDLRAGTTCFAPVLDVDTLCELDKLVNVRNRLQKGESVFHAGDHFRSLFAIRSGSCKTVSLSEDGHEQVSGYHMPGEIIGTDGIGTDPTAAGRLRWKTLRFALCHSTVSRPWAGRTWASSTVFTAC